MIRMVAADRFYIDGQWVMPAGRQTAPVINPATATSIGEVALGEPADAEAAIAAARKAFPAWSATSRAERLEFLRAINAALIARCDEIAAAISKEMGAPADLAREAQAPSGPQHFGEIIKVLEDFPFTEKLGTTMLRHEAVGVAVLITPWNWPMNQIATKVAPALAAGCTMVLKPSECAPFDAAILADIMDKVGLPPGVFNLVHGTGEGVGSTLTQHPDVDMVSFTGSTRAGIAISTNAAPSVKRVALELGGKSANIILPGSDLARVIPASVRGCMSNTGQSCNAPTRLLVQRSDLAVVNRIAAETADELSVGMPEDNPDLGPVANQAQFLRVREAIQQAQAQGWEMIAGGPDCPAQLAPGFFIRPTIFTNLDPQARIACEEVFGPVLAIIPYDSVEDAISIANASTYGLSGYVWGPDPDLCREVAARLRTGMVHINGASLDSAAPFGGYKMSGNGREWGVYGLREFLEVKSVFGGA